MWETVLIVSVDVTLAIQCWHLHFLAGVLDNVSGERELNSRHSSLSASNCGCQVTSGFSTLPLFLPGPGGPSCWTVDQNKSLSPYIVFVDILSQKLEENLRQTVMFRVWLACKLIWKRRFRKKIMCKDVIENPRDCHWLPLLKVTEWKKQETEWFSPQRRKLCQICSFNI